MDVKSELVYTEDNSGNRLYVRVHYNEHRQRTFANLHLRLKESKHPRNIGSIDFTTSTFHCKRSFAKHYHNKTKGFGFNWNVINDKFLCVEKIHLVVDEEEHYLFSKSLINDYGLFLNFKTQGFELQRFISFNLIKIHNKYRKDANISEDSVVS